MARLITSGAELNATDATTWANAEGMSINAGTPVIESTKVRTGSCSLKFNANLSFNYAAGYTLGRTYFLRTYILVETIPSGGGITILGGNGRYNIGMTTSQEFQLYYGVTGIAIGSPVSFNLERWYRLELSFNIGSGSGDDSAEFRLEGNTIASESAATRATSTQTNFLGTSNGSNNSAVFYTDDMALNDNQGTDENTWAGEGRIVLFLPTSDFQRGSWTGGVGGTTNLYDAVNNTPPIGTATETDTSQIESADSTGDNSADEYRGTCDTYATKGILNVEWMQLCFPLCNHGEDIATNTKTGSFAIQNNPVGGYTTFTYGADAGALATYPSLWTWTLGTIIYKGSGWGIPATNRPQLAVRKTDAGTRVASVDFLGMYAEYEIPTYPLKQPVIYPDVPVQDRSRW